MLQGISGLVLSCYSYLPVTTTFLSAQTLLFPLRENIWHVVTVEDVTLMYCSPKHAALSTCKWGIVCIHGLRVQKIILYLWLMTCKSFEDDVYKINWESGKITCTLKFKLAPYDISLHQFTEIWLNDDRANIISLLCTKYNERNIWI